MPIAEAFERDGEEAFRAREAEVVGELLERADGGAIALGGGSVLSERVREALGRHTGRLAADRRRGGLAADRGQRATAGAQRRGRGPPAGRASAPLRRAGRRDRAAGRSGIGRPGAAVDSGADRPAGGDEAALGASASGEYPVLVGPGLLGAGRWPLEGRRFCVTDTWSVGGTSTGWRRWRRRSKSSRARRRRRWPRRSGCCASWRVPG